MRLSLRKMIISAFLVSAVACSKDDVRVSANRLVGTSWTPVHAKGEIDLGVKVFSWDEDLSGDYSISFSYKDESRDVHYEMQFTGYTFYEEGGQTLYSTFSPNSPETLDEPLRFHVEKGRLYMEVYGNGTFSSTYYPDAPLVKRIIPVEMTRLSRDVMEFDGVTYRRLR